MAQPRNVDKVLCFDVLVQRSLLVDVQQFQKNREQVPLHELEKHVGKYVAWSPDGSAILASDTDPIRLLATVKALGHDPAEILVSSIADPDLVVLGGGGFID